MQEEKIKLEPEAFVLKSLDFGLGIDLGGDCRGDGWLWGIGAERKSVRYQFHMPGGAKARASWIFVL